MLTVEEAFRDLQDAKNNRKLARDYYYACKGAERFIGGPDPAYNLRYAYEEAGREMGRAIDRYEAAKARDEASKK